MLIVTLLNLCFWLGIWLMMAKFFQDVLAHLLATVVVGFATIVVSLELLSLGHAIQLVSVTWICGFVFVLGIFVAKWPQKAALRQQRCTIGDRPAKRADRPEVQRYVCILIVGFAIWAALDCLLYGLFTPVQADSDAPIYHLPFAFHWAKVGRLDFVTTPFGEEGAPYFPANGDLWLAWLALTSQGAAVVKIGQWPFLLIGGMTLYATARQAGASRESAAIVAGIWSCLPLTLRQSSVANVDLIWTAFYFIALFFVMRYRDEARRRIHSHRDLWLSALSLGIVLGTKSVGLAYAPLLIGPLIWLIWVHCPSEAASSTVGSTGQTHASPLTEGDQRKSLAIRIRRIGLLAAGILLPAGYWFARNFWMTGNPLYPLDVSWFNHRILVGWYDTAAMRATAYHIPVDDWPVLVTRLWYTAGPWLASLWIVCVVSGVLGAIWSIKKNVNVEVQQLSLLALLQVGIYWLVVPYNTQERFLLAALGIGLVPLATALTRWPSLTWPVGLVFLGHISLALPGGVTAMDDVSFRTLRTLMQRGCGWRGVAMVGSLAVAGPMLLERRWFGWILASVAILTGCFVYGAPLASLANQYPERSFYPQSGFGARMQTAWQIVANASRPTGARIAYAGGNLPYYLLGMNYGNDAVYVNINRHQDWLPHDYHKARRLAGKPDTAAIPWPQWYREEADYRAWLGNLSTAQIDLLFVSRINLHGRRVALEGKLPPFPIEKTWADAHPEEFEDLGPHTAPKGSIPWARVYRLRERSGDFGVTQE